MKPAWKQPLNRIMAGRNHLDVKMLAAVLHRANACPPAHFEDEFYEIKQLILETWGTKRGHVVQRIVKECWGYWDYPCGGDGDDDYGGSYCDKCGGTGIYETKYFKLEEWELCGRLFHRPVCRLKRYKGPIGFEGKKKAKRTKGALDCFRALSLLFKDELLEETRGYESMQRFRKAFRIAQSIGPIPRNLAMQLWTVKEPVNDGVPF